MNSDGKQLFEKVAAKMLAMDVVYGLGYFILWARGESVLDQFVWLDLITWTVGA
jgi:hypothetical protein